MFVRQSCVVSHATVAAAELTFRPANELATVGSKIQFGCKTSTPTYGISWRFYSLQNTACMMFFPNVPSDCPTVSANVSMSGGWSNLTISHVDSANAGTYVCGDLYAASAASALLGVVGMSLELAPHNFVGNCIALKAATISIPQFCWLFVNIADWVSLCNGQQYDSFFLNRIRGCCNIKCVINVSTGRRVSAATMSGDIHRQQCDAATHGLDYSRWTVCT